MTLPLIILPGLDGQTRQQDLLIQDALHLNIRPLSFPNESLSYTQLEELIRADLPPTPFVLLGQSFSSPLAISIAATPPSSLKKVILSTPFPKHPWSRWKSLSSWVPLHPPEWLITKVLFGQWYTPMVLHQLLLSIQATPDEVLKARVKEALSVDVRSLLPNIKIPVHILHATSDRLLTQSPSWAQAIPHHHIHAIDGPHLLLQAKRQAVIDVLDQVLRDD